MSPNNQFDAGSLTWVRGEIDVALQAASAQLAQVQANPQLREPLRYAQGHIHQASGALAMMDLDGVSHYAEAIDRLLSLLAPAEATPPAQTLTMVRDCIGILGNYLGEIASGVPHQPLRLYGSYQGLVTARGDETPDPSELFFPDLSVRPPLCEADAVDPSRALPELRVLRGRFQKGLLTWLRKPADPSGPAEMLAVARRLERMPMAIPSRAFWWAVSAFMDGLSDQSIRSDRPAQRLCRRIDAQIGRLLEGSQVVAERMMRDVLYSVATADKRSTQAQIVCDTFKLDDHLPVCADTLSPSQRHPVVTQVREVLESAKSAWNRFCSGLAVALPQFQKHHAELRESAKALGVEQINSLLAASHELLVWLRTDPLRMTDALAMEIATALLLVEQVTEPDGLDSSTLRRQVALLCDHFAARQRGELPTPLDDRRFGDSSQRAQTRILFDQLAREIQANLGHIEQTLDAFFRNPGQRPALKALGGPLKQVEGAFNVLGETDAAKLIAACAETIIELAGQEDPPAPTLCDTLARQFSAVGFFVEASRSGPVRLQTFLDAAGLGMRPRTATPSVATIEVLNTPQAREADQPVAPLGEALRPTGAPLAKSPDLVVGMEDSPHTAAGNARPATQQDSTSLKPDTAPPALLVATPAETARADQSPPQAVTPPTDAKIEDVDAELLAIFLEEAHEVLAVVASHRDECADQPRHHEALITIRRGFHTLKGSSRMVGLQDFSEAARHVELAMNRWLQLDRDAEPAILSLIASGYALFTEWVHQLERGGGLLHEHSALVSEAEQLLAMLDAPPHVSPTSVSIPTEGPGPSVAVTLDATQFDCAPFSLSVDTAARLEGPHAETRLDGDALESCDMSSEASDEGLTAAADKITVTSQDVEWADAGSQFDHDDVLPELGSEPTVYDGSADEPTDGDTETLPAADAIYFEARLDTCSGYSTGSLDSDPEGLGEQISPANVDYNSTLPHKFASSPIAAPDTRGQSAPATEGLTPIPDVAPASVAPIHEEEVKPATAEMFVAAPASPAAIPAQPSVMVAPGGQDQAGVYIDVPQSGGREVLIGNHALSENLYQLYIAEARQHLDHLFTECRHLLGNPLRIPDIEATRAAHTLAGISGTTCIEAIHALGKALEHALKGLCEAQRAPDKVQVAVLGSAIETLDAMLAEVMCGKMPLRVPELVDQLERLHAEPVEECLASIISRSMDAEPIPEHPATEAPQPEHAADQRDELDLQLLPIFLEEADELTGAICDALRDMRKEPAAAAPPLALARLLHTLKGSARMAGAFALGSQVHDLESRLESSIASQCSEHSLIDELENGIDQIGTVLCELRNQGNAPPARALKPTAPAEPTLPSAPIPQQDQALPATQGTRAALRVRAELVDRFVNEAGEISIARTRIEGEMRTLRRSLLDLTENVIRLRNQLRDLEIQADSQMQSRMAATEAHHSEFDPLEFDRFTRLQEITRMMAESVGDVTTIQQNLLRNLDGADIALHAQGRLSRDLQQALMSVRMVPFDDLADRLYRIVRQTAKELGKRAKLEIIGGHIELDRGVLERITAPLEHLLRNAIAHGIEVPEVRQASGKPEQGHITLKLSQQANEIAMELMDDGAGLDYPRILERGRNRGLLGANESPTVSRLNQLIFEPGFSTAQAVSGIAGRGVGMDVVKNETLSVGGRIDIASVEGQGTRFVIHLPVTLAVTQALLVRACGRTFALPATTVEHVLELKGQDLEKVLARGYVDRNGAEFPYHYLPRLLGDRLALPSPGQRYWLLLLRAGSQSLALQVDELIGNQEIVVKSAGPQFVRLPGFSGATVLSDGEIALILNPGVLASAATDHCSGEGDAAAAERSGELHIPTIMVVDDSLTVRKITTRLLEREGFRVITAKDGVDALERLAEETPEVMLLDIEMPRMDGFDLARNVRADARLRDLPIIMITSRIAEKHRNYAKDIGVNHYLGKPYQEEELLELITAFIAERSTERQSMAL